MNTKFQGKENYTLLFDLDNTIYPEIQFLKLTFKRISLLFENNSIKVENFLNNEFSVSGRLNLYNKLLFKFPSTNIKLKEIIDLHSMEIETGYLKPFTWFQEYIETLNPKIRIITNGNVIQQKNKILSLNIEKYCSYFEVVYANEFKPKPSPDPFFKLRNHKTLENPIYIGDNEIDKIFSDNCGIQFYHVKEFINDSFLLKQ